MPNGALASEDLLALARTTASRAYCPYSRFRVGAVAVAGGHRFVGCNVENASYGLTVCAERVAIWSAVAAGHSRVSHVAVACVDARADTAPASRMPCGACRQVMAEFLTPDAVVDVDGIGPFTLPELLPRAFTLEGAT